MSRPRSRSPRYRMFPWEEPDFDPYKVLADLDGDQMDRNHPAREDPEGRWDYFREDVYPEGRRRSPFPVDRHADQEEFYRRRPSPRHDAMGYDDRRLSPLRDGGGLGERRRGGFREHLESFENGARSPRSPLKLTRERLPLTPKSHHQQREPAVGWRREEEDRGRGRVRDLSPSVWSDDQRGGAGRERGRRHTQGPNRERRMENSHQERNPPLKRQRREMEDASHLGYRNEEDSWEQHYSLDTPRDGFGGDTQASVLRGDNRHMRPLVIEHGHGIKDTQEQLRWEHFDDHRGLDPDLERQRSPRPMGSSQERFSASDVRLDDRNHVRGHQGNWRDPNYHEIRRSPLSQDRPNPMRYGNRDGSMNHKGRGGSHPARGRVGRGQGGRTGPPRNQPRLQQSSQGYQELPREEQRTSYRPLREDCYEDPTEGEPDWAEETRLQPWTHDRRESMDRHIPKVDLDPKMPRQRARGWHDQKANNKTLVTEETLTIKVDMSRPVHQNR